MASEPFGPDHFQLVLLRRMADHHPELVDDALRALGADHGDLRDAHRRWQARLHSRTFPGGERRYRTVLGPPVAERTQRIGELDCKALLWPVPLWPDLRFEVLCAPGSRGGAGTGPILNEWLVRAAGAPAPDLRSSADLTPWSCTVEDAARAFPPATPLPPDAPTRSVLALTTPDTATRTIAHFTWGLLQYVTPEQKPGREGLA